MGQVSVLLERPQVVICQKPAGVLSQAGKPGQETMVTLLEQQLGGPVYPVHRLDREVGGVMAYARTPQAAADLSRQIQQGTMVKEYLALVEGCPAAPEGCLTDLLFHDARRNKSYVVQRSRKGVKEARLLYRVLGQYGPETLVQIRLLTGRTHQIRVQFASRGLPLVGDTRYGGPAGSLALWAVRLTLQLPGGPRRTFTKLPETLGTLQIFPPLTDLDPKNFPEL